MDQKTLERLWKTHQGTSYKNSWGRRGPVGYFKHDNVTYKVGDVIEITRDGVVSDPPVVKIISIGSWDSYGVRTLIVETLIDNQSIWAVGRLWSANIHRSSVNPIRHSALHALARISDEQCTRQAGCPHDDQEAEEEGSWSDRGSDR